MNPEMAAALRRLPKIDAVLARADVMAMDAPRWAVVEAVRAEVEVLRRRILSRGAPAAPAVEAAEPATPSLQAIERRVAALLAPSLRRVINATGVVLHTNLGRAPLAPRAVARMSELAAGYTNLEYELGAGRRGSRHGHLAALLTRLTGAEDAVVVNNNAAAVLLCLGALAADREVIVSRGELVEIGGSFRIPDVMRLSGARMIEVGTTNKTRAADYEAALSEATALLLKVHRSNFAVVGFTEEAPLGELAALGARAQIPTMMDLGSGSLLGASELTAVGLAAEPGVAEVVASGVDLVTFSGDKLLGGPQAGIVCGRRALVDRVRRHPLMRALRPDKLALAALEATLTAYRDGRARAELPALAMLAAPAGDVRARAEAALSRLPVPGAAARVSVSLAACESTVGGGAMPLTTLPSFGLCLEPREAGLGAGDIERALRDAPVPVIGRIAGERVILDVRTVMAADMDALIAAVTPLVTGA